MNYSERILSRCFSINSAYYGTLTSASFNPCSAPVSIVGWFLHGCQIYQNTSPTFKFAPNDSKVANKFRPDKSLETIKMNTHLPNPNLKHNLSTQNPRITKVLLVSLFAAAVSLLSACASTTRTVDPDTEQHYDASYDFSDKKQIVQVLTDSLLSSPNVLTETSRPVVIIYGVDNETSEHINTGGITDDIRLALIKSGEYRFLNRKQRDTLLDEADYQYAGFVPPEQRVAEGRQLGADFILSGTLRSIKKKQPRQWRISKTELIYYSMNMELTDLQSGEITWADNVEIAREASRPVFGW